MTPTSRDFDPAGGTEDEPRATRVLRSGGSAAAEAGVTGGAAACLAAGQWAGIGAIPVQCSIARDGAFIPLG